MRRRSKNSRDQQKNRDRLGWWRSIFISVLAAIFLEIGDISTVWAGEFFADFNAGQPAKVSILGHAILTDEEGRDHSGALKLTAARINQIGSMALEPLDGKDQVCAFTVEFKMLMGGGGGGDGLGVMFLSELPTTPFNEQMRGTGITVVFDSYKNRANQVAPSIRVYSNKVETAVFGYPDLRQNHFVDVMIKLDAAGLLNVKHSDQLVVSNFPAIKINQAGQFGFAARTGSATDNHLIDDLKIVTETLNPHIAWAEPSDDNASLRPMIRVGLKKSLVKLEEESIALKLDGTRLEHQLMNLPDGLVVSGEPEELLEPGSAHQVSFTFRESGKTTEHFFSFGFTVSTQVQLSK